MMRLFVAFLLLTFVTQLHAQVSNADISQLSPEQAVQLSQAVAQARETIKQKGLNEEEVKQKMKEKGVDLDNLDPATTDPNEVERVFNEVVTELEQEKQLTGSTTPPDETLSISNETVTTTPAEKVADAVAEEQGKQTAGAQEVNKAFQENLDNAGLEAEEIISEVEAGKTVEEAVADALVEEVVEDVSKTVNIYGQQLFRNGEINEYLRADNVKPPKSYIIGVGDQIAVSIFGPSIHNGKLIVDEEGFVQPVNGRRTYVKGLRVDQIEDALAQVYARSYRFNREQFSISLDVARVITVNIVGEVAKPGPYTISAINGALNALAAAGGPTNEGTLRAIEVRKYDGSIQLIDVYEYRDNPKTTTAYAIENGDIIFVPRNRKLVSITGAVKRPAIYELKDNENLEVLLELAQGFDNNAYLERLQLRRIENGQNRIIDVDFATLLRSNDDLTLQDDDAITVRALPDRFKEFVVIDGAVDLPGEYQLMEDMRVLDLVELGILQEEARTDIAYLTRKDELGIITRMRVNIDSISANPASELNMLLLPKDQLTVASGTSFLDKGTVAITGAVRTPIENLPLDVEGDIRVSDLVILAGGLTRTASPYAYIVREDFSNPDKKQYLPIDLSAILEDPESSQNRELLPFDVIRVFDNTTFTETYEVQILGSTVRNQGSYPYAEGMTLNDLLYLAGGIREDLYPIGYIFRTAVGDTLKREYIRVNIKEAFEDSSSASNLALQPLDDVRVVSGSTFKDQFYVTTDGEVRIPGIYTYDESLRLKDVLTMSGGLTMEAAGNHIDVFRLEINDNEATQTIAAQVEVDDSLNLVGGQDFQLQPFDLIVVRRIPDFDLFENITIQGEVEFPGIYPILSDNERLRSFIERAGGITLEGFPEGAKLVRVERGDLVLELDKVMKNQRSKFNYIMKPGDVITIPKQEDLVAIKGAVRYKELYPNKPLDDALDVPYHKGKRAKFYVNRYATGIGENGKKGLITVEQPSGKIDRTVDLAFFKVYPKVEKGSVITVGTKPPKVKDEDEEGDGTDAFATREPVDWASIARDLLAQVTSVVSLVVLIERLPND